MTYLPKHYKMVKGVGKSKYPLVAFDNALRDAGIGDYNLVKVSSIIPAGCEESRDILLPKGSVLYAAYATVTLDTKNIQYAGVAVAVPSLSSENGVIFECTSNFEPSHTLYEMCHEAMENRQKSEFEYFECVQAVQGNPNLYSSAIAAVVLW